MFYPRRKFTNFYPCGKRIFICVRQKIYLFLIDKASASSHLCPMKMICAAYAFLLMFWNVENFFEHRHCYRKSQSIAKTIFQAADGFGQLPDIIGLAEVENHSVLQNLLRWTSLSKHGYSIIHYDSPDRRGIDCALLYRKSRFREISSKPCHIYAPDGKVLPTRDILLALLQPLDSAGTGPVAVLVNHHPSKLGGAAADRRRLAMERLLFLRDSLLAGGIDRIVAVGDFNDTVEPAAAVKAAYGKGEGTYKYQGEWDKIDGCPVLEGMEATEYIFSSPQAMVRDRTHGGIKPLRSFSGPHFQGGPSDHLPVVFQIKYLSLEDR